MTFKDTSEALLWYLRGLLTKPIHTIHHPQGSIIHLAFNRLRVRGKIRVDHFYVLEFYARKGLAPEAEGREYKAHLLWAEVVSLLKPALEERDIVKVRQWWQA